MLSDGCMLSPMGLLSAIVTLALQELSSLWPEIAWISRLIPIKRS